ncbi:2-oxo-3-hexenedioate decarboxylase [Pseudomonas sp. SST3]|jgi:2-oxo-3-hexenedioate decarboxylase|uniref:2-oxo-3-hexenedioate decarboxylase n=1 Tax=Pseudomonas sp. SST3 TaxID=2267882 RepID=UPI000DFA257F|nr:2-oxo-3-hexenedioate decarboxylase [Pseudomonas sp. SST3]NKQ12838.1 2-oxo-3-hexenedioate decarboxylase [Pseudomonas sp. SST3]
MSRTLSAEQVAALADHLESAELDAREVCKVTKELPDMTFADAYDVQWEIRRRKEARGSRIVGMKMGLTSWAKMAQMGVETPIYGFLADYFSVDDGGVIDCSKLIHPKIEAEIAFVTKAPLRGPGCHVGQVLAATDFVVPTVEVIDSRYENFQFDLISVVADNASSTRFVVGGQMADVADLDLRTLGVVVEKNGQVVEVGAGAAVLGHPASSVAMLANLLAERDEYIPAGTFIMTGGITAAISTAPGDSITVRYQGLGSVSMRFE